MCVSVFFVRFAFGEAAPRNAPIRDGRQRRVVDLVREQLVNRVDRVRALHKLLEMLRDQLLFAAGCVCVCV